MKNYFRNSGFVFLFITCFYSGYAQQVSSTSWNGIDSYLEQYMKDWQVPGLAVVVIKNDKIVLQKTLGYADLATGRPVTNQTIFSIGSCTKQFTAAALLMEQDANHVGIDNTVATYFSGFTLADSLLGKKITIKDILSHRTGLERGDYVFYGAGYSRNEIIDRLKYLRVVAPVRNNFIYNNLMYTLAGTVIEKVSGQVYEDYIKDRIFKPAGMLNSAFNAPADKKSIALPYVVTGGRVGAAAMPILGGVEPAGGIWTNLDDMTRWLSMLLRNGMVDTMQLLSKRAIRQLQTPVVFTGGGMRADETEFKSYGLGFGFTAYKGHRVMYHTGVSGGYITHIAMMPEEKAGIVLMANVETYTNGLVNNLFDRILEQEQTDWNSEVLEMIREQWKAEAEMLSSVQQSIAARRPLADAHLYTGKYFHPACRQLEIQKDQNGIALYYNGRLFPLVREKENSYWAYDGSVLGRMEVSFSIAAGGLADTLNFSVMGEKLVFGR
jgi:CubicO group peptidase (beta-lactamase class C family)